MRNERTRTAELATLALILAGAIGGLGSVVIKIALKELSPEAILFLRLTIMVAALAPFAWRAIPVIVRQWRRTVILGALWAGNIALFVIGSF